MTRAPLRGKQRRLLADLSPKGKAIIGALFPGVVDIDDPPPPWRCEEDDDWRVPFVVARRLYTALEEAGLNAASLAIGQWRGWIERWGNEADLLEQDGEAVALGVERIWESHVCTGRMMREGDSIIDHALRGAFRLEANISEATFPNPKHHAIANLYAGAILLLSELRSEAYLSRNDFAAALEKVGGIAVSPKVVREIVERLKRDGTLRVVSAYRTGDRRCDRLEFAALDNRKPREWSPRGRSRMEPKGHDEA